MKTILLFMLLFQSIVAVGQTDVKYIIKHNDASNDRVWVVPEAEEMFTRQAVHGKAEVEIGMTPGNLNYWKTTLSSIKELYFTKEQLALFKEKRYNLLVRMIIDNVGNVKCVKLMVNRKILEAISQKQLNDIYQAFWRIKPPMNPQWSDKYYWVGNVGLIP